MRRFDGAPHLTTRDVAELCGAAESTVQYSARVGTLRGRKVSNRWQFESNEAYRFCDEWIHEKEKRRRRAGFGWRIRKGVQRTGSRVVGLLNLVASVVSLAAGERPLIHPGGSADGVVRGVPLFGNGGGVDGLRRWRRSSRSYQSHTPTDPDAGTYEDTGTHEDAEVHAHGYSGEWWSEGPDGRTDADPTCPNRN
jgi:hypothetical protein